MSKSVKYRLLFVIAILAIWGMETSPIKNLDFFAHVTKISTKVIGDHQDESKATELEAQITEALANANQVASRENRRVVRELVSKRSKVFTKAEVEKFEGVVAAAKEDVAKGNRKTADSPVVMNPAEALGYQARLADVDLYRFLGKPKLSNKLVISQLTKDVSGRLKLGIDLKGGVEFIVAFNPDDLTESGEEAIEVRDKIVQVLKKRIDSKGVAEAEIRPFSDNTVLVRVPVVNDEERNAIAALITRQAELQFRLLHPDRPNGPREVSDIGYELVPGKESETGSNSPRNFLLKVKPEMTGKDIVKTSAGQDENGNWLVFKTFNAAGAADFGRVTTERSKFPDDSSLRRMAIVLDGVCYSAPNIITPITGGSAQISGMDNMEEAQDLALVLQSGSLPVKIKIDGESRTDATLGATSIASGVKTTIVGVILVMLFMIWYYKLPGLFAAIALCINLSLLASSMMIYGATFTLPGLAGIALTLGMAVDSNVLIFERIREELGTGRIASNASREGFSKAWSAIFDANITTFMSALILYNFGTGPIQGFAITLAIGIVTTMFTTVFVARIFFDWMNTGKAGDEKKISGLGEKRKYNIDFWNSRKKAFGISTFLCILSIVTLIYKGSDALSVDFTGGTALSYVVSGEGDAPAQEIIEKALVSELKVTSPRLAYKTDVAQGIKSLEVVFKEAPGEDAEAFNTSVGVLLNEIGADNNVIFQNSGGETIGGLVGDEFSKKALWAMLLVMLTIFIYISFRFESIFALGALAALAHDALIALGIFVLFGNQISLPIIGAILTIMGYSLNDTIVVFDRVREKSSQIKNKSIVEIVNMSVNDMLGRTILTSLTTLFVVIILCFGGGVQDFAFVLTVGIAIGTFSSIYVAAPIVCNNKMQNQLERITAEREEREIRRANDQTVIQEEL